MTAGFTIQLRFFASVREQLGCSEQTVTLPPEVVTVGQVRQWLIGRGGVWAVTLAQGRNLRAAYQQEMCDESVEIADGHEVAFFPPVTGG
ncbi:molybdopterin converting factor subunit 1 [Solimicrobium silvestre]|uniref:MoaD: molybdopterin converting factor, subunit 1 n=1 Tax=Solimicrobium silvestre TaxID=2099400 RepID=A0A2S9GXC3_9BURK|nr:molybdopterin converting factor subunit 1 [Solimicrobium silvestre]PRC92372.1 moaD: molybdopterin converting factor, subunit 1 [Solimicrobium silvestre]